MSTTRTAGVASAAGVPGRQQTGDLGKRGPSDAMKQLARYWERTRESGDPKVSPAIDALNEVLHMGRQVRMHVLLVAQSATARALGGPEVREQFATRILARYSMNAWRMLAPRSTPRRSPPSNRTAPRSSAAALRAKRRCCSSPRPSPRLGHHRAAAHREHEDVVGGPAPTRPRTRRPDARPVDAALRGRRQQYSAIAPPLCATRCLHRTPGRPVGWTRSSWPAHTPRPPPHRPLDLAPASGPIPPPGGRHRPAPTSARLVSATGPGSNPRRGWCCLPTPSRPTSQRSAVAGWDCDSSGGMATKPSTRMGKTLYSRARPRTAES